MLESLVSLISQFCACNARISGDGDTDQQPSLRMRTEASIEITDATHNKQTHWISTVTIVHVHRITEG